MGERRGRLTLGRMMAVIGVVALILATFRANTSTTPAVSVCVFAACAWYLASRRFAESMARRAAEGLPTSRAQRARILAGAAGIALVVIGLPDAAFLAGYIGYMQAIRSMSLQSHWSPDYEPWHMTMGAVIGIACALYVASWIRYGFGPIIGVKSRSAGSAAAPREANQPMPEHQPASARG